MTNPTFNIFGGIIAFLLFLLYASILIYMMWIVIDNKGTTTNFSDGLIYVVTTVSGLVSALVITKLAITEPGDNPARLSVSKVEGKLNYFATILAHIYLGGWIFLGLGCLITGLIFYPEANENISDLGTTWLGLAVASGYTYFGLGISNGGQNQ